LGSHAAGQTQKASYYRYGMLPNYRPLAAKKKRLPQGLHVTNVKTTGSDAWFAVLGDASKASNWSAGTISGWPSRPRC